MKNKQIILLALLSFTCVQQATAMHDNPNSVEKHQLVAPQTKFFWAKIYHGQKEVKSYLKDVDRNCTNEYGHSPIYVVTIRHRDAAIANTYGYLDKRIQIAHYLSIMKPLTEAGFTYNDHDKVYLNLAQGLGYDSAPLNTTNTFEYTIVHMALLCNPDIDLL